MPPPGATPVVALTKTPDGKPTSSEEAPIVPPTNANVNLSVDVPIDEHHRLVREIIAGLLALVSATLFVIAAYKVLNFSETAGKEEVFARQKDVLVYVGGFLALFVGYYTGRAPGEVAAALAQASTRQAQAMAATAQKDTAVQKEIADKRGSVLRDAENDMQRAADALKGVTRAGTTEDSAALLKRAQEAEREVQRTLASLRRAP